jgi:hypothetical protein
MTVDIQFESRSIVFGLDFKHSRWHSLEEPQEAAFPLVKVTNDKRYQLDSDGSLVEFGR